MLTIKWSIHVKNFAVFDTKFLKSVDILTKEGVVIYVDFIR